MTYNYNISNVNLSISIPYGHFSVRFLIDYYDFLIEYENMYI